MNGVEGERWRRLARNGGKRSLMLIRPVQHTTHGDVFIGPPLLSLIYHKERVEEKKVEIVQLVVIPMSFDYSIDAPKDERIKVQDAWGGYYYVTRKYDATGVNLSGTMVLFSEESDSHFSPALTKSSFFTETRWSCGGREYDSESEMIDEWGRPYVSLNAFAVEWVTSYGVSVSIPFKDYNDGGGTGSTGTKSFGVSKSFRVRFEGYDDSIGHTYSVIGVEVSGNGSIGGSVEVKNFTTESIVVNEVNVNDADFPRGKDVPTVIS